MFEFSPAEIVGYVASALVVLSLTMTSVVRLRSISLAGSVTFVAYGLLIGSLPILVTNASIAAINIWFLRAELGMRRDLGASRIAIDSPFLADFVEFHLDDIRHFQPDFSMPDAAVSDGRGEPFALVLLRDGMPAGALVGRRRGTELEVVLDYVLAAYRDSRLGNWLYGPGQRVFRDQGITTVVSPPGDEVHRSYLARMGFRAETDEHGERFVLDLG